MRHANKVNALSRKYGHRRAMLANMASSLIRHKRIRTTTAKARVLRRFVEPIISRSREDSTHSRRLAFRYLRSKEAVKELFGEVAAKVGSRPGGYTRILKVGENRPGDNAEMAFIELVDFNENLLQEPRKKSTRRGRRTRRSKGGGAGAPATARKEAPAEEAAPAEEPKEKAPVQSAGEAEDVAPATTAEAGAPAESVKAAADDETETAEGTTEPPATDAAAEKDTKASATAEPAATEEETDDPKTQAAAESAGESAGEESAEKPPAGEELPPGEDPEEEKKTD